MKQKKNREKGKEQKKRKRGPRSKCATAHTTTHHHPNVWGERRPFLSTIGNLAYLVGWGWLVLVGVGFGRWFGLVGAWLEVGWCLA